MSAALNFAVDATLTGHVIRKNKKRENSWLQFLPFLLPSDVEAV
jgi:hypothetical protein